LQRIIRLQICSDLVWKTFVFICCLSRKPFSLGDCDNVKVSGSDGVAFGFIKDFWVEFKDDIMRFVSEFHWNGKLTKGINCTCIALISKVNSHQRLKYFRPISLMGCLYKLLSKVMANRLRSVIGSVVSNSHSDFAKGGKKITVF